MRGAKGRNILFISTGASLTGVPLFFISMMKWMKSNSDFNFTILTAGKGPLANEYLNIANTYNWDDWFETKWYDKYYLIRSFERFFRFIFNIKEKNYRDYIIKNLIKENYDLIYVNGVSSLRIFSEIYKYLEVKAILHVHELQISIHQFCGAEFLNENLSKCSRIIAISDAVALNLKGNYLITDDKISVVYTFSDTLKAERIDITEKRADIREQLNIPQDAILVGSGGTTEWRKGVDLLYHIVKKAKNLYKYEIYFIWVGGYSSGLEYERLVFDFKKSYLNNIVYFLGEKENPLDYFAAIDIFMLCSREEPVGMVALEAASLKKPILCFDQAGGMPEFVENDCGFIVPYLDIDKMVDRILLLAEDPELRIQLGENAACKVKRHDINIACKEIENIILETLI